MHYKLIIRYSTMQAPFAATNNFGSDVKNVGRVLSKQDKILNYHQTQLFSYHNKHIKMISLSNNEHVLLYK